VIVVPDGRAPRAWEKKLQATFSTRLPYEFANFHRVVGVLGTLLIAASLIGLWYMAFVEQPKHPWDVYSVPIWHVAFYQLSPIMILLSDLVYMSRPKSKNRLNTAAYFIAPFFFIVEGVIVEVWR
jgi:hypothetical protein